jgi:hypothetical protein
VRHGATATISLTRVPSDRKERVGNGMHMTFTAGGNGFVGKVRAIELARLSRDPRHCRPHAHRFGRP